MLPQQISTDELQYSPKTEGNFEYTKIQGFDVLEKLPGNQTNTIKSYNDEFYNTLSNLKFLSITIPQDNKLFYHFENNRNAPITTQTGQLYHTCVDLGQCNEETTNYIKEISEHINNLKNEVDTCDVGIIEEFKPAIENLEVGLRKFLVEQKTENFKLVKQIAILEKEKEDLWKEIELCNERLSRVEKDVENKNKKKLFKLGSKGEGFGENDGKYNSGYNANNVMNTTRKYMEDPNNQTLSSVGNPKKFGDTISAK